MLERRRGRFDSEAKASDGAPAALLRREPAACALFVRENAPRMLAVARRIIGDRGHAEDIVQDAFANFFSKLDTFDGRAKLTTWMHRIVVNQALMALRKSRRSRETPIDPLLPVFDENGCRIEASWPEVESPEKLLQQSDTKVVVANAIDLLPESYRIVLVLRDLEELSTREVADLLGLTEANVKVRLHRARSALKRLLEPLMKGEAL